MATKRSDRDKIRFACDGAKHNILDCQDHLARIAMIADNRSDYINTNLPPIMAVLSIIADTLHNFKQGL